MPLGLAQARRPRVAVLGSPHVRGPRVPAALADLDKLVYYIVVDSPAAERSLINADRTFVKIAETPRIGRVREELDPFFRKLRSLTVDGFPNHLVFYEELPEAIRIVRVIHGARRLSPELFE